jgi:hypothetical protein
VADLVGDCVRLAFYPAMRQADDAVALDLHGRVASSIALECLAVPVELPAIGLNHQLLGRPERINLAT